MKRKPKKLNLDEIWRLYILLESYVDDRVMEKSVIDSSLGIIDSASPQDLLVSLRVMYDNKVEFTTPSEFNELFISGIVKNEFLEFCEIIRGMNGSSNK